jgi:hypothetical protein
MMGSCKQVVDTNLNVDPTAPLDASLNVLLPSTQASFAYIYGGDIARYTNAFTQQITGTGRQMLGAYNYSFTESDVDNAWTGMYTAPMIDLYIMIQKAKANGSNYYLGMAEIEMAACIGMWTDVLGPIPYSQAFQGNTNLRPAYDTQATIYTDIQNLLDSAIVHLSSSRSTFTPASDDLIFGGDVTKWIKTAYSMKARYYLHLKQYASASAALAHGSASNADDFQFNFGATESTGNPMYQFISQRTGDITIGVFLFNMMDSLADPRIPFYAAPNAQNQYTSSSEIGPFFGSINSPVIFSSFVETEFIDAELQFRAGNMAAAYTAYLDGITASLNKMGVAAADIATYLAKPKVGVGQANLTLENIMNQKYIAMFTSPESWTDWRRTGFPTLIPTNGTQIPRRFPYPISERLYNGKNLDLAVPNHLIADFKFTRVGWDTP